MTQSNSSYGGYSNYMTWIMAKCLFNNPQEYEYLMMLARVEHKAGGDEHQLAELVSRYVKRLVDSQIPNDASLAFELLNFTIAEISFVEISQKLLKVVQEDLDK
jgi:hypothetical protein